MENVAAGGGVCVNPDRNPETETNGRSLIGFINRVCVCVCVFRCMMGLDDLQPGHSVGVSFSVCGAVGTCSVQTDNDDKV